MTRAALTPPGANDTLGTVSIPRPVPQRPGRPIGFHAASRELLRHTVLDAMRELLTQRDWVAVTMGDVAAAAGVSRQTVYNEFGNRTTLAQAYALRLADQFIDEVVEAVEDNPDDLHGALTSGVARFFGKALSDPLIRSLITGEAKLDLLRIVTLDSAPIIDRAAARLTTAFTSSWVQARQDDARTAATVIVRLALSYISMPPSDPQLAISYFTAALEPFLQEARMRGGGTGG